MAFLKYVGRYDRQEYSKKDFSNNGIDGQGAVSWQADEVREVTDEAAQFILGMHGDDFEEVADAQGRALGQGEDPDHEDTGNFNGQDIASTPPGDTANIDDQSRVAQASEAAAGGADSAVSTSGATTGAAPKSKTSSKSGRSQSR